MPSDHDVRCSNACTRAGIAILLLSAISFAMIRPLERSQQLDSAVRYTSSRLKLVEEFRRLEDDVAWRGLMATSEADQARNEWSLAKLLDYTFKERLRPRYAAPQPSPAAPQARVGAPTGGGPAPAAPTDLHFVVIRRIEPLHRMADALTALRNGEHLMRARRFSASMDRAIYDWEVLRHRLRGDGVQRNNPGVVLLPREAGESNGSFFSRFAFWAVEQEGYVSTYEREELLKTLRLPDLAMLATHEPPTVAQADALVKEGASITFPSLGVATGLHPGATLVQFAILISLSYFWLYYREARQSTRFPIAGTLFGALARTRSSRTMFSVLLVIPPAATAILASKLWWYSRENAVIALVVAIVAASIRMQGALPNSVHEAITMGDTESEELID